MKQMIDNREMVDKLNDLNHDYQRMRKLAKRRINGRLTKYNKAKAQHERDIQSKLGGEAWVDVRNEWVLKCIWIGIGMILGMWIF